jgi:hypothetical protein
VRVVRLVRGPVTLMTGEGEGWGGVTVWRGSGDADFDEAMKLVPA